MHEKRGDDINNNLACQPLIRFFDSFARSLECRQSLKG